MKALVLFGFFANMPPRVTQILLIILNLNIVSLAKYMIECNPSLGNLLCCFLLYFVLTSVHSSQ